MLMEHGSASPGGRQQHRTGLGARASVAGRPAIVEAGQMFVESRQEARRKRGVGRDDVDGGEAVEAGEQVEVGDPEAVRTGGPISCRDDDAPQRCVGLSQQVGPHLVFVGPTRVGQALFVAAERRHHESRLRQHPCGAKVFVRVPFEPSVGQALEIVHRLQLAPDGVVERQHLGQQARLGDEGRGRPGLDGLACGCRNHHLPLHLAQATGGIRQALAQLVTSSALVST